MKISFYLHNEADQIGRRPIYCRYSHSGKVGDRPWRFPVKTETGVGFAVLPADWVKGAKDIKKRGEQIQRVRASHVQSAFINSLLDTIEANLTRVLTEVLREGIDPFPDTVKKRYQKAHARHDVLALFSDWAKDQTKGKSLSTAAHYTYAVRDVRGYAAEQGISFARLDADWGGRFLSWAVDNVGNMATASGRLARFKAFVKWAYAKGYHKNTGFEAWKGKVQREKGISLSLEDLQAIRDLSGLSKSLEDARDVLLWLCFSGMRHGEYYDLESAVLTGDVLTYKKNKTRGNRVVYNTLYLNHVLRGLWTKYDGPPIRLSRYSLNKNFKTLGKLAGLVELVPTSEGMEAKWTQIKTHTGRATLATLMDKYGAALGGVQRSLGHAQRGTTEGYIKSRDGLDAQRGFDSKIRELWQEAS